MDTEDFKKAREIFKNAIEIEDPAEQKSYLDNACGGDQTLRAEVESLLEAYIESGDFLDIPAVDPVITLETAAPAESLGDTIGNYKLLERIGEGGMAIVYMAEQKHPIRRRVALKIIKLGMDTKQVIGRFEAERQALAMMDHPNIAKVLDAGTTDNGRPYFVMELVRGVSITKFCDTNHLNMQERLDLFISVCRAVQHAHQRGIIHRDIKPSNIMVTLHDGEPVVKVIDFGIAKAVNQQLTEKTVFTRYSQMIGTPEYMSPEQAEMSGLDIDTRTDVFSLGVVLYELLTGTTPFDNEYLLSKGYAELQRIIREEEPVRPSTKISTMGEAVTDVAKYRRTNPESLCKLIKSDLDWIVMRTLEKDRNRRYHSPQTLAEDIQRHLGHEPVLAGPPSKIYRLQKFLQKHRTQAIGAAVAAVLLAVIAVISAMLGQAIRQNRNAESLEHQSILSKATDYHSKGQYEDAMVELDPILYSEHVGPQVRLLRAHIDLKLQGPDKAISQLEELTNERDEIACQAHFLLAKIYLESAPGDPDTREEYQQKAKEHQEKAQELFPERPEAYYNRALMAVTVNKSLEYLDKALILDPSHYDSLAARALAYYALKDYDRMGLDASKMVGNTSGNPRGYALLAIALRERAVQEEKDELLGEAIKSHNKAIHLSPDDADLYNQRRLTYLHMANHREVLSDANDCVRLKPTNATYHFNVFCALVALGEYDKAEAMYNAIIKRGIMKKTGTSGIDDSSEAYVFDVLNAGLTWHPPGRKPEALAFAPMLWAESIYEELCSKGAERIVTDGFTPSWSNDGTRLVYSRGILGHSGIEILNLKTRKTELLTASGFDPSWSPDGLYIAFERDRETVLLADLVSDQRPSQRQYKDREIWLVKADGTEEPRFLVKGSRPQWSSDSKRVLYRKPGEYKFFSISREGNSDRLEIPCHVGMYAKVSPNDEDVAWAWYHSGYLRVLDRDSGTLRASWPGPGGMLFANWAPDGNRVTVGGGWSAQPGLWIYDIESKEARRILNSRIMQARLSPPDSRQIVFQLAPPYGDLWLADTASLEPGLTLREHYEELGELEIARITRLIETDPENEEYYRSRALWYTRVGETEQAMSDLEDCERLLADPNGYNSPTLAAQAYHDVAWRRLYQPREWVDPQAVVEMYDRAHTLRPGYWEYLCGLGAAYYRAGQWKEAVIRLTESTDLGGGGNATTYFFLAMAHWQSGEKSTATDWYDRAMKWIEYRRETWHMVRHRTIYDLYWEASELLGIRPKEIVYTNVPVAPADPVGTIVYDDAYDTYTILGSGRDIFGKADQFHYAHTKLNGDGKITARIDSIEHITTWTKTGVMIRESTDANSAFAYVHITPWKHVCFKYRSATGKRVKSRGSLPFVITLPCWVQLEREGNTFTGRYCDDGREWKELKGHNSGRPAVEEIDMNDPVHVGLAVCSQAGPNTSAEATMSNVTITGDVGPAGEFLHFEGIGFDSIALPDQ